MSHLTSESFQQYDSSNSGAYQFLEGIFFLLTLGYILYCNQSLTHIVVNYLLQTWGPHQYYTLHSTFLNLYRTWVWDLNLNTTELPTGLKPWMLSLNVYHMLLGCTASRTCISHGTWPIQVNYTDITCNVSGTNCASFNTCSSIQDKHSPAYGKACSNYMYMIFPENLIVVHLVD